MKGPVGRPARVLAIAGAVAAWAIAASAHAEYHRLAPALVKAGQPSASLDVEDPFEGMNRRFYAIHQALDHAILHPLAIAYSHVTPGPIGKGIHNFITEIGEPVVFGNDVLQLRIKRAATTLARFVINATAGVGGLMDPATKMGLPYHENGFGTTLGRYGIKPGPYLFIPLIGPTDFRDIIGTGVDFYSDPVGRIHYPKRGYVMAGIGVVGGLDQRVQAEPDLEQIESMGTDSYATLRSLYLQKRQADIQGERPISVEDLPNFDDDTGPPAATPPSTGPKATPAPLPSIPAPPTPPPGADKAPSAQDPGVASPSSADVPAISPDSGPDAAYFLAPPSPPPGAQPSAGPPLRL